LREAACSYPFFGTLLGWLGVATTGSDTASNLLFGKSAAHYLGAAWPFAHSDGGGQFIRRRDGQDDRRAIHCGRIHRHGWVGHESSILRFVFVHSIVLAVLVGILVTLQAYVYPFTEMVVK
jgi:lactate permease